MALCPVKFCARRTAKSLAALPELTDFVAASDGFTFTYDLDAVAAKVGPDTVAKYLMTSGSTSHPKGVLTTQRMLCVNQAQIAAALCHLKFMSGIFDCLLQPDHFGGLAFDRFPGRAQFGADPLQRHLDHRQGEDLATGTLRYRGNPGQGAYGRRRGLPDGPGITRGSRTDRGCRRRYFRRTTRGKTVRAG